MLCSIAEICNYSARAQRTLMQMTLFVVSWALFALHTVYELWDFWIDAIAYVHVHVNAIKTIIFVQINQKHEHYCTEYNVSNLREAVWGHCLKDGHTRTHTSIDRKSSGSVKGGEELILSTSIVVDLRHAMQHNNAARWDYHGNMHDEQSCISYLWSNTI